MNSEKKKKSKENETLTLDPHSDELRKEKKEDLKRRKARGEGAYLEDLESKPRQNRIGSKEP